LGEEEYSMEYLKHRALLIVNIGVFRNLWPENLPWNIPHDLIWNIFCRKYSTPSKKIEI